MNARLRRLGGVLTALAAGAALAACSGPNVDLTAGGPNTVDPSCTKTTKVKVVLQWVAQSQFAGYYAAKDRGFYGKECLQVTIQEGGVNVVPQQVLASGNADFAVSHVTKTMASRAQGADLVNISQIFQRGAYLQVSWKDTGIARLQDLKGKRVGSWGFGNDLVLRAASAASGVALDRDAKVVQQPFDMSLLLKREIDAAQAKTYNEYAQLLETTNPRTGELYQPSDFSVINLQDAGFTSLEDGIYARGGTLKDKAAQDVAVRFLKATMRGWVYCRDRFDDCVDVVLNNGAALGKGHMTWSLNEVNKLIWPSPQGLGHLDPKAWKQTLDIARGGGVLKADPGAGAYRTDLSERAMSGLKAEGVDVTGASYEPRRVTVTPGGK
ncbi:ABC transporter substrate-binding protein [Actinomadura vinacea]|uniref:Thiamine pyrimidine synthase n=1 Tax=Actinomadura vinacea TaxID=115336 RepID=A0ABN3JSY9_9ACTN